VLKTAGGASVTIEGGNITFECPGKILVKAGKKSFVGPGTYSMDMNAWPKGAPLDEELVLKWKFDDKPVVDRSFEIERQDGTFIRGKTDKAGKTGLQKSEFLEALRFRLMPES
jgi:type VI secretion system secreted protein VgrG